MAQNEAVTNEVMLHGKPDGTMTGNVMSCGMKNGSETSVKISQRASDGEVTSDVT